MKLKHSLIISVGILIIAVSMLQFVLPGKVEAGTKDKKACVSTRWTKIFSIKDDGTILWGSFANLYNATYDGCDLKVVRKSEGQFGGLSSSACAKATTSLLGSGLEVFTCIEPATAYNNGNGDVVFQNNLFQYSNFTGTPTVEFTDRGQAEISGGGEEEEEAMYMIYARH